MKEYTDKGFTVKYRALSGSTCKLLHDHWQHSPAYGPTDTPKDVWQMDRLLFDISTGHELVGHVCELIGDNVSLWGASLIPRKPGQVHKWHSDVETSHSPGFVSAWIGISGTKEDTALRVIPKSHLYGQSVLEEQQKAKFAGDLSDDETVIALARGLDQEAQIEVPSLTNGDALIFDGRIWHGSNNQSEGDRLAMLVQFARSDETVRKRRRGTITVPPKFETDLPKVFPISGEIDDLQNPVAKAPANGTFSDSILTNEFRQLALPLNDASRRGWKPYYIARGATPNTGSMSVHASTLAPGKSPHPPHCHLDEEILLILEGEADIVICDDASGSEAKHHLLRPGDIVFYPPYQHHTIVNNSTKAVNYLMFRWSGKPECPDTTLDTSTFNFSFVEADTKRRKRKFRTKSVFEASTHFLEKLECHRTILEAGGGYASHADEHDVAIIVFAGEVTVNGQQAGPGGVFYIAAGTPHDMQNNGQVAAQYLVFEFHAQRPELGRVADTGGRNAVQKSLASRIARRLRNFSRRLRGKEV